jgi:uncharacterized protein (TIGR03435 family)
MIALTAVRPAAQSPRPAFEAASVKANTSGSGLVRMSMLPGRLSAVNVTLRMLVRNAYGLPDFRISGGPNWMDADRFDVEGKAVGTPTFDQIRAMTQTLLQDRFALRTHNETRELPIYVLMLARRDGKLGDQLKRSGAECLPMIPPPGAPPPPPPPPGPAPPGGRPQCGSMLGNGNLSGRKLTIERLVATLSQYVNRAIVDQTNLAGEFDIDLRWQPDLVPGGPAGGFGPPPPIDPNAPSLFTALQEQLGLKLESQRGPVDVLVIDGAGKPSAD